MHYELYVDSLFFLNFIMNLYLLLLVDRSFLRIATLRRMAAGAAVGAAGFLLPFLLDAPAVLRLALGFLAGTAGMLWVAFPVKGLRMFLKLLERLALYSFGMGGAMLFLVRMLRSAGKELTGVIGILGTGGLAFLLCRRFRCEPKGSLCRATLCRGGEKVEVSALVDSGNSLVEPVSGKPVCVAGREVAARLWGEDEPFRAVPYSSIGKRRGILRGYLLPRLLLEADGVVREFDDVYVAVSEEELSGERCADAESVEMIVNPGLFSEGERGRPQGRQKREAE